MGAFTNRNGPNNRNGPGITGTDLSCTYFFSSPIFISRLFSSYLYAYRRIPDYPKMQKRLLFIFTDSNLFIISLTNADISSNGMVANALENIN